MGEEQQLGGDEISAGMSQLNQEIGREEGQGSWDRLSLDRKRRNLNLRVLVMIHQRKRKNLRKRKRPSRKIPCKENQTGYYLLKTSLIGISPYQ